MFSDATPDRSPPRDLPKVGSIIWLKASKGAVTYGTQAFKVHSPKGETDSYRLNRGCYKIWRRAADGSRIVVDRALTPKTARARAKALLAQEGRLL